MPPFGPRVSTHDLVTQFVASGDEEFGRAWPWPAFVKRADRAEAVEGRAQGFHTEASRSVAASELVMRRAHATGQGLGRVTEDDGDIRLDDVLPIRKRESSTTFGDRVGIGRAANMDVVIELPRISKYHAYVQLEAGRVSLCDARSTFGTFVDDQRLEPLVPLQIDSGAHIALGPYSFRFYDAAGLRAYLAALARRRAAP